MTPPATAMWLSLMRMASSRPKRWLVPPPQRTAYFSKARRPGVVLRVSQMRALVCLTLSTKAAVAVAMPERWQRKLSATRSAERMARAGSFHCGHDEALGHGVTVGRLCASKRIAGSTAWKAAAATSRPARTPRLARDEDGAWPCASAGMVAAEVMSPARPRSSFSAARTASAISRCGRAWADRSCRHQGRRLLRRPRR